MFSIVKEDAEKLKIELIKFFEESLEDLEGEENNQIRIPQNITGSAVNPGIGGRPEDSGASEE